MNNLAVLIPSYKPANTLYELIKGLRSHHSGLIIVVNDGNSCDIYLEIFRHISEKFQVEILHHAANLGKGRALKSGFNHILLNYSEIETVVTADADGQHSADDIFKISKMNLENNSDLTIGERTFSSKVPLRSKFGNIITSYIFRFLVGLDLNDTQTGLRAFKRRILPNLLRINGERYEYETNILLETKDQNWHYSRAPISTIYIDNNEGSHFNPLFDSMKIYFLIIRFLSSSFLSSLLDFIFFGIFIKSEMKIYESMILARLISGWVNFYLNRRIVFKQKGQFVKVLIRYWSLVFFMGTISSFIVNGLIGFVNYPIILKLLAESMLFLASFAIQKDFIFNKQK